MCRSLSVFVDGWPKKGTYLWHLGSGAEVSRRPPFVYFGAKTTQKPAGLEEKDEGRQLIRSETPKQKVKMSSPGHGAESRL